MDDIERVRTAADRTVAAGSARLTMTSRAATALTADVEGTIDFTNRRSWARLAMPPGTGDHDGTVEVEMVIDGPYLYIEVVGLPGRWLRTRLDEHGDDMPAGDPGLLLDWLRGCTKATPADATDTSSRDVDLAAFDVVLDLDRAVEAAPEGSRHAVRTWIDQIAPDGRPRAARLWLDTHDRVHRLTVLDPAGDVEAHFTDHGQHVEIAVPDDTAVVDPEELRQLLPDLPDLPEPPPSAWDQ